MSSTNKTSLGLNMWEASDKPVRQDFVNDNAIIDEKISELNSNLDELIPVSTTTYSGAMDASYVPLCTRCGKIVIVTALLWLNQNDGSNVIISGTPVPDHHMWYNIKGYSDDTLSGKVYVGPNGIQALITQGGYYCVSIAYRSV